jgi:prepilin-type N-terminal cleavage/methylation domain-containing protein
MQPGGHALITKKSPFSLIELLVVCAILGILSSLLMPSLRNTLAFGTRIQCSKNLSLMNGAMQLWTDDNGGQLLRMDYQKRGFQRLNGREYPMNGIAGLVHEQYTEVGPHLYCPNVEVLKEAHNLKSAQVFIYKDSVTDEVQAFYGKANGPLLQNFEVYKTYFLNVGRYGDSIHHYSNEGRKKAGLFKIYSGSQFTPGANGRNLPIEPSPSPSIYDVDPDTIAMVEADRGSGALKTWGTDLPDGRGFTLGLHENEGFNAAIIDGSVRWVDLSDILGDEKFSTGTTQIRETSNGFLEADTVDTNSWGTRWHWGK